MALAEIKSIRFVFTVYSCTQMESKRLGTLYFVFSGRHNTDNAAIVTNIPTTESSDGISLKNKAPNTIAAAGSIAARIAALPESM